MPEKVARAVGEVRRIENEWIPLEDGTRLAARLWLPADAEKTPVPAILEYIPYRKRDFYRHNDELIHPYFAARGYACVRLDLRGSGDSDGVLLDEYLKQEQDDAVEAIEWIARQKWCTGKVGMMGISWGGFNALQVAARRPPALKAIITACSTDDRYADDVHYMGGALLTENLVWAAQMFVRNPRPPDPALLGEHWRAMWMERLEGTVPFILPWLTHQRRDAHWKHGSVCEDYGAIECAVYAIGGWADAYSNAVPRLMAGLKCPRKGLVGPWPHSFPHHAVPGPQVGFLDDALDWWDHWLKGIDTGTMDGPMYRVWMQESVAPRTFYEERPGRWVAGNAWPSPNVRGQRWALNPGRLERAPAPEAVLRLASPQTVGIAAGEWCPYGAGPEWPADQRLDDAGSLVFDSEPLGERLEILGPPVAHLEVSADRPNAFVAARLSDVLPDGRVTLVTYGILNLTHREGHETPLPLEPGKRTRVRVQLNDIAHAFPKGNRIRLALSTSYWPTIWPSPEPVTLSLFTGASALELPVRAARAEDADLAPFPPAYDPPPLERTYSREGGRTRHVGVDAATGETTVTVVRDSGRCFVPEIDLELDAIATERSTIRPDDPLSASIEIRAVHEMARREWRVKADTRSVLTATATEFRLRLDLDAFEGDARVFSRSWNLSIPRDGV